MFGTYTQVYPGYRYTDSHNTGGTNIRLVRPRYRGIRYPVMRYRHNIPTSQGLYLWLCLQRLIIPKIDGIQLPEHISSSRHQSSPISVPRLRADTTHTSQLRQTRLQTPRSSRREDGDPKGPRRMSRTRSMKLRAAPGPVLGHSPHILRMLERASTTRMMQCVYRTSFPRIEHDTSHLPPLHFNTTVADAASAARR